MRKIRVGIDIDGTLRDFNTQFMKYAFEQYNIRLKNENFESWGFPNVTDHTGRKIIQDVFANPSVGQFVYEQAPTLPNAYTGYRMFVDHPGIDVFIVSSQKKNYEEFSNRWLVQNGFTGHVKTFYERNKLKAPVQILIDDKPDHVMKFLENQRDGVLVAQPHNQDFESGLPIKIVDDMIDAYQYVLNKYSQFL